MTKKIDELELAILSDVFASVASYILNFTAVNIDFSASTQNWTVRAKKAKGHFAYFAQRDQHWIEAQHLTDC